MGLVLVLQITVQLQAVSLLNIGLIACVGGIAQDGYKLLLIVIHWMNTHL